ncbi:MAG: hypothetical protein M3H12_17940, partial [Chromatiales bacterium]
CLSMCTIKAWSVPNGLSHNQHALTYALAGFQENDASARWTATRQTRTKTHPTVWMCSVLQQSQERKTCCNNSAFGGWGTACGRGKMTLSDYFVC